MSKSDPESEKLPVIEQLEGFPDPVRDPDTGMIVPQTRRERRALEAAQEKVLARKTARQKNQQLQPEPTPYSNDNTVTEDLDFGSDPASPDPKKLLPYSHTFEEQPVHTPEPQPARALSPRAGRNAGIILVGYSARISRRRYIFYPIVLAMLLLCWFPWVFGSTSCRLKLLALTPAWVAGLVFLLLRGSAASTMVFALFGSILLTVFWTAVGEPDKPVSSMATTILAILWLPFSSLLVSRCCIEDGAACVYRFRHVPRPPSDISLAPLGKHRMAKFHQRNPGRSFWSCGAIIVGGGNPLQTV